MLPAFYGGVPSGNDQAQHYQFTATIYESLANGVAYPSLATDTNHGFGDIGIRFYPPLTYYVISAAYVILGDWYFASLLAFTLVFFAGGIGIYLWAREEFEPDQALIAAVFYIFAPYHLNQIYNNFLLAEFFSTAIFPFCLLFLTRVCRKGRWVDVFGLAIAYTFLILTHLPMTVIGSLTLGIYGLILMRKENFFSTLGKSLAAVLLSVIMTAFYWSRMLPELTWLKHLSPKYFSSTWDYRSNFLFYPSQLLNFRDDVLNLWFADLMLFTMMLICIPTIIYLGRRKIKYSRYVLAVGAVLGLSVFMATPLSSFIWDNVEFLQKTQFPWRWLEIVSAFGALFASIGVLRALATVKNSKNILIPMGIGAIFVVFVFMAAFIPRGSVFISRAELAHQMKTIPDSEGCECWWPIWAERLAFAQTEKVNAVDRKVDVRKWSATEKAFHIGGDEPVNIKVASFYYPRWRAMVNGSDVPVETNESGTISVAIPAGPADVELTFHEPTYVKAAYRTSLIAWLFVIVFAGILLLNRQKAPLPILPVIK